MSKELELKKTIQEIKKRINEFEEVNKGVCIAPIRNEAIDFVNRNKTTEERRWSVRRRSYLKVFVARIDESDINSAKKVYQVETIDISSGGIRFLSSLHLKEADVIRIKLDTPSEVSKYLDVVGMVIRVGSYRNKSMFDVVAIFINLNSIEEEVINRHVESTETSLI